MIRTRLRHYPVVLSLALAVSLGATSSWQTVRGTSFRSAEALALPGPNAGLKEIMDSIMQALRESGNLLALNEIVEDIVEGVSDSGRSTCPVVSVDPPFNGLVDLPQSITLIADYNGSDGAGCAHAAGTARRGRLTLQATDINLTGLALSAKVRLQADRVVQISASGEPDRPLLNGLASADLALGLDFSGKVNLTLNIVSTSLMAGTTPITGGVTAAASGLDINGAPSDVAMQVTFDDLRQGTSLTTGRVTVHIPALALSGASVDTLTMRVAFDNLMVDTSTLAGGFTAVLSTLAPVEAPSDTVTFEVTFDEAGLVLDESTFFGGLQAVISGLSASDLPGDAATVQLALKPLTVVHPVGGPTTYEGGGTIVQTVIDERTTQTAVDMTVANYGPIVLAVQAITDDQGQTLIATLGEGNGRVGVYQVEIVDAIRFDPAACETLPVGGKIHFMARGEVSTAELIPTCDGSYLFNGQLSNVP